MIHLKTSSLVIIIKMKIRQRYYRAHTLTHLHTHTHADSRTYDTHVRKLKYHLPSLSSQMMLDRLLKADVAGNNSRVILIAVKRQPQRVSVNRPLNRTLFHFSLSSHSTFSEGRFLL